MFKGISGEIIKWMSKNIYEGMLRGINGRMPGEIHNGFPEKQPLENPFQNLLKNPRKIQSCSFKGAVPPLSLGTTGLK